MAAAAVLAGAHSRHAIFRDELVRRAYYTAEAAHRGHSSQPAATGSGLLRSLASTELENRRQLFEDVDKSGY
ncbi:putative GTP diphosphokinase RSH3, chloroplastic [Hordeum vulgare]|nr:putative GTP diphosphokinase RSH3, chloroplastic [Hordeum vulgare]